MEQLNWHTIYTQLSPKLLGICRRYIKDIETAEDIVQDAFIIAIQKQADLKNLQSVNGWLSRIVINNAVNYLKTENKISYSSIQDLEIVDETTMTNTLELDKKTQILAYDFSQNDLLEAIDSLSENHKSVFNMYIIDQFTHIEISKLLSISVGTSKSSLSRARKAVQEFLIQKLSGKKTEEKKKRRIALLIYFGLGNQMFANYFRKSFSTFEIKPKKGLNLSRKTENSNSNFTVQSSKKLIYLKASIFVIGLAFLLFYFMKNNAETISNEKQPIKDEIITTIKSVDSVKIDTLKSKKIIDTKREFVGKNVIVKNSDSKTTNSITENAAKKDSVAKQEPAKVVVIKKQIVKKDTVYVQR